MESIKYYKKPEMEIMMLEMHDVVTGSNLSENPNEGGGYEGLPGYPTTTSF